MSGWMYEVYGKGESRKVGKGEGQASPRVEALMKTGEITVGKVLLDRPVITERVITKMGKEHVITSEDVLCERCKIILRLRTKRSREKKK